MRGIVIGAVAAAGVIAGGGVAHAAVVPIAPTTFVSATNEAGTSFASGAFSAGDTISFRVSGESFLQINNNPPEAQYGTNAAGVLTTGSDNTAFENEPGGFETFQFGGKTFTYGALLVQFNDSVPALVAATQTAQFLATDPATGAGSSTPPSVFTYTGTLGDLFGAGFSGTGTLSFVVADTGYFDNAGGFTVSAVPEASTWAMMIAGVGAAGGALRRRRVPKSTLATA